MAVAQAQALVPELGLREAELEADAAALEKLALWALRRYSPLVAVDPPDGLVIDATGAAHLHGGEDGHAARHGGAPGCFRHPSAGRHGG